MQLIEILKKRNIHFSISEGNITVGGSLDLEGTAIAALPNNLTVGGYLDLEGTAIAALPDNLTVGGSLDLEGTAIAALPDNLTVGGYLFLRGTAITALPNNLTVGYSLYVEGNIGDKTFKIHDELCCLIISSKKIDGITIEKTKKARFKNGKCVGDVIYVAVKDGINAHGETAKEAVEELMFKKNERNVDEFRNMPLDIIKTPEEWAFVYRQITGSCRTGIKAFMSRHELKESYSLAEILEATKGAYRGSDFRALVLGKGE